MNKKEILEKFENTDWVYIKLPAICVRFEGINKKGDRFVGQKINIKIIISKIIDDIFNEFPLKEVKHYPDCSQWKCKCGADNYNVAVREFQDYKNNFLK